MKAVLPGGDLARLVGAEAERAGLAAVGFAPADAMTATRLVLEERKANGLHGGMEFTYRNPARSTDPARALPGAASLVVGAWSYAANTGPGGGGVTGPTGGPPLGRVARYAVGDFYGELRAGLGRVAAVLDEHGWRTKVLCDDNALVDRAAAERAGLGWFGKNANLLLPGRGSWFVLGSVVTDAPLPPSVAAQPGCGSCRRCLSSCPTGALVAPGVLDARKCLAWLLQAPGPFPREHRAALGDRIYGCDECQEACPPNRSLARALPSPGQDAGAVDLLAMLRSSDDELMARFGRWYIPRRDPRYLRRNALIALGNVMYARRSACSTAPLELSAEVDRALLAYLASTDELLQSHAVWAAARAGRPDLVEVAGLREETASGLVAEELALLKG